jgi:hypothetical protein
MVLLISYDLNGSERPNSYKAVADLIKEKAISYRRPLYSQWFVETVETPQQWSEALKTVTDSSDRWFASRVQIPYAGWLDKEIWDWLRPRL